MSTDLKELQLALQVRQLKQIIANMDLEYVKKSADGMMGQASWQDSAAVLNPSHPLEANDLLRTEGKALLKFIEFADLLKQCEKSYKEVKEIRENMDDINKMFQ